MGHGIIVVRAGLIVLYRQLRAGRWLSTKATECLVERALRHGRSGGVLVGHFNTFLGTSVWLASQRGI